MWLRPNPPGGLSGASMAMPYNVCLSMSLAQGHMIVLNGRVKHGAQRFNLDLTCGPFTNCEAALHVNPRFNQNHIVLNTRSSAGWGSEEFAARSSLPLKQGEPFYLHIFVAQTKFLITIDGRHLGSYAFRLPISKVDGLQVDGDVEVFNLEHRLNVNEHLFMRSHAHAVAASMLVPTFPQSISRPRLRIHNTYSIHNAGAEVFRGDFPQQLVVGCKIEIMGYVKSQPKDFAVNLTLGQSAWPQQPIVFHFNPRFNARTIVRNAQLNGTWGPEETSGGFPLTPASSFLLGICCEQNQFRVEINGANFTTFNYRHPIDQIGTINVRGDVEITDIYISY